ncbi:M48 family metallopeptidase [Sphingomonadaceae bacterium OTU29THOMA1]|nr:M48 family metallopeptidase [Sphingomonadaceae bacterium OTU29THOMA1]
MPSMSVPSELSVPVWHYDGTTAVRRQVSLVANDDGFWLDGEHHAFADLTPGDGDGVATTFGLQGRPGWRIGFEGPLPADIAARLPGVHRYGRWVDRLGLWRAAAIFAVVAAVAVLLVLRTPALVARMIPASVEQRIGEVMVGDFGRKGCEDPAGRAALATLVRRIDPDGDRIDVHVVKLPMVNAVTLPGGRIVIFDGLLQSAASPDEVAGVIGHEIGHVRHRDVMESLLRQMGLAALLGGMEGHVGAYTNAMFATAYSRDAERRADGDAIRLLSAARLSPLPTAAFFDRLGKGSGHAERMFAYLASHPVSTDRAKRFRSSIASGAAYTPALGARQWSDLRGICKGETDRIEWRF